MANPEHLEALKKGAQFWNEWRKQNKVRTPDLSNVDLSNIRFAEVAFDDVDGDFWAVDLKKINLRCVDFRGANLINVDLRSSELDFSKMNCADLRGAKLSRLQLVQVSLKLSNLENADLSSAIINGSSFEEANLKKVNLRSAKVSEVRLNKADLRGADLSRTFFNESTLHDVDLRSSVLSNTHFQNSELDRANLTDSGLWSVNFVDVDLSGCIGLDSVRFLGPCFIGLDTLYKSQARIPDSFLRNAGVSEDIIHHLLPLIRSGDPIQWDSCFISYSTKDDDFARRLHGRMREANMRVWFAPEDMKGGDYFFEQIERAIQLHDRLLLVLSEESIQNKWVEREIRKARKIERSENRKKLFPITLIEHGALKKWECLDSDTGEDLAEEVRRYHISDFSNWKDHDSFEAAFSKLQNDLRNPEKH